MLLQLLSGSTVPLTGGVILILSSASAVFALRAEDGTTVDDDEFQLHDAVLQLSARARIVNPFFKSIGNVARRFSPAERTELLERRVAMAGLSANWPIERVMFTKLVLGITGLLAGIGWFFNEPSAQNLLIGAAIASGGWMGLDFMLDKKAQARQAEILMALPDVLDQMTIIVEAGLGFEGAFQKVIESNDNPLTDEFGKTLRSIRLGMSRHDAMLAMVDRTDCLELRMFVRALNQADKSGIPITQVLRTQADEVREKRRQRAEERAMALPVKLLFPLVLFILPALFMMILGPAAVQMIDHGGLTGGTGG